MNGKYLKYIISDRESTIQKAADTIGCTAATFSKRLANENYPASHFSIEDCEKLAEAYNMTDKEILKAFFNRE